MIPTVASVTPKTGRTGGRYLLTVYGTGFQLPPVPPATGPAPAPNPSVRVSFMGSQRTRVARNVYVLSSKQLLVEVPPGDAPSGTGETVALVVENIDQSGVVVPGESVTVASAFTYKMPDLTVDSTLVRVVKTLLQDLKRQVLYNVSLTTDVDYDANVATASTEIAALPALVLVGPRLQTNRIYALNPLRTVQDESDPTLFTKLRPPRTRDLYFDITGASTKAVEVIALMSEVERYFERTTMLTMDVDATDPTKGTVDYEMQVPLGVEFALIPKPNESNVKQFTGAVVIRGVDMDDEDMSILRGRQLQEAVQVGTDPQAVLPSPVIIGTSPAGPIGQGGAGTSDPANPNSDPNQPPPEGIDFEQIPP